MNTLIYHQRTNFDLLSFNLATLDQRVLFIEERNERWSVMATVRLRCKYESADKLYTVSVSWHRYDESEKGSGVVEIDGK